MRPLVAALMCLFVTACGSGRTPAPPLPAPPDARAPAIPGIKPLTVEQDEALRD